MEKNNFGNKTIGESIENLDSERGPEKTILPKEEIQKKITELEKNGWKRNENRPGLFYFTKNGTRDMHYLDEDTGEYLFSPAKNSHHMPFK